MSLNRVARFAALGFTSLLFVSGGCGWAFNDSDVLVLDKVNVPSNGGSADVMFSGVAGQVVEISLTGRLTSMVPIGNLVGPGGTQTAAPTANTSVDGFNSTQVTIPLTGVYHLEVSDDNQLGGAVTVRVEVVADP